MSRVGGYSLSMHETPPPSSRVWVVSAFKGGVGKTSTAVNLAAVWAASGRRILVIDLDPQGAVAAFLGLDVTDDGIALVDSLLDERPLTPIRTAGIDLCVGGKELGAVEVDLHKRSLPWQSTLADLIRATDGYDEVLIDTPPGFGALTMLALVAGSSVIIPTTLDPASRWTIGEVLAAMRVVQTRPASRPLNPGLRLAGILPTLVDARSRLARLVLDELASDDEHPLLAPRIPARAAVREATLSGVPIVRADPSNPAAIAYRELARHLMEEGR